MQTVSRMITLPPIKDLLDTPISDDIDEWLTQATCRTRTSHSQTHTPIGTLNIREALDFRVSGCLFAQRGTLFVGREKKNLAKRKKKIYTRTIIIQKTNKSNLFVSPSEMMAAAVIFSVMMFISVYDKTTYKRPGYHTLIAQSTNFSDY
ncbi:14436_t:CDS:2 [Ambispora leptoticha]|uniref:14436_t:CDS:1 n=1 Tax=Ambispora leptoticha TaxID=144679 RepID=A0A9N8VJ66_9GLOM|nr:14436_t:CDS:2 [Ambispora leptoticha]